MSSVFAHAVIAPAPGAILRANLGWPEERFSPHDLKRKGITDTPGTGAEKKDAAGLSEAMMKTYDKSVPIVKPSAK